MKIIFLGTSHFSSYILTELLKTRHEVICVISQPNKAVGRKKVITETEVYKISQINKIRCIQPNKIIDIYDELCTIDFDLLITAAYGQIIPQKILDLPKVLSINVHGSLLPKYRGASPIQTAIINGEEETGITIMRMVYQMDAGEIISQKKIKIAENDTADDLFDKLKNIGSKLLNDTIDKIEQNDYIIVPQNEKEVTFAPMLDKNKNKIDWMKSAKEIHNLIRGLYSWPYAQTLFNGKSIKIISAEISFSNVKGENGEIVEILKEGIVVKSHESYILIKKIQIPGKNILNSYDYFQNFKNKKIKLGE